MLPFTEKKIDNSYIREFSLETSEEELVWHRDREDRLVKSLEVTDWKVQIDNNLPQILTEIFIPKGVYHRIIKGTGSLKILITKYS